MNQKFLVISSLVLGGLVTAQHLATTSRKLNPNEIKAALSSICEAKIDVVKSTCYPKKSFYDQTERDPKSQFFLRETGILGSFSKANSKQIIVTGVFNDANGFPERFVSEVSVLLEQNKVVRVVQDGGFGNCAVFAIGNGRDGLICHPEAMGMGNLESSLEWRDTGMGAKTKTLLSLVDNTAGGCGDPAKTFSVGQLERQDTNNDKKADLIVNLEFKTAANPNCDVDWSKIAAQKFKLVFLWDAQNFKPDAKTASIIKEHGWN